MVFDKWYLIKGIRKMVFDKVYLIKNISAVTDYNSSSCCFPDRQAELLTA